MSHCDILPEICVKMFIFKVDVQSDHLETKCSWVKVSQGKNVTVDVSSGSKCYSGRNVGGRNVKASDYLPPPLMVLKFASSWGTTQVQVEVLYEGVSRRGGLECTESELKHG